MTQVSEPFPKITIKKGFTTSDDQEIRDKNPLESKNSVLLLKMRGNPMENKNAAFELTMILIHYYFT